MRGQLLKTLVSLLITLLCLGSLLSTLIWFMIDSNNEDLRRPVPQKKRPPKNFDLCKGCKEVIEKVLQEYSQTWKKQEDNYLKFRSKLNSNCHGPEKAFITQGNTPVGTKIVYDGEKKRSLEVTSEIFSTFVKVRPFLNKTWDTCAVVGNGGILTDSGCGAAIDSAQFVIRCNLPPLKDGFEKHVGVKTSLVTANPSILRDKYGNLMGRRRAFVEDLKTYSDSLLLLPAFSYGINTPVSLRASYTIEDFGSPIQPVFFNPEYLRNLANFWRSQGLRAGRPSTGLLMASLALELCNNVDLYGFWPFDSHPYGLYALTNHYYDDRQAGRVHAMPAEFQLLMRLHNDGVLKLHIGDCRPGKK
ncbi:alpha-2,8-sialyltransferase 8F-like [Halichoeres trimaculatus]|uniref:alpha-2,8-sialyltransferase 8F-like n=1 Tax=Halichoeres trimaculatus TaxID=147232 RepID=UPI003D9E3E2B